MTNREFENYLALVSRLLRLKRGQCEQIANELRDHLELRVAELIQAGTDSDEATRRALEEFGDAASVAGQFQFITQSYQKRWMMRFATLSVAGLFLAVIFTMAMWPNQARFGAPESAIANGLGVIASLSDDDVKMSDDSRRNTEIRKILTTEASLDCVEMEFADVMESLSEEYGVNFILDHTARNDSLQRDTPIDFSIQGIPLNKALKLMLLEHNATYLVSDGVVRIISLDVASASDYFSRQIFDVSVLVKQINNAQRSNRNVDGQIHSETDSGGAPSGGGQSLHEVATAEQNLIDVIKTTIAPDSWDDTNGDGTADILGGLLIVNQTEENSLQIGELLQDLSFRYSARVGGKN